MAQEPDIKPCERMRSAEGYVANHGIEYGYANIIPLWSFGLNY